MGDRGVLSGGTSSNSTYGDISWWTGTAIYRDDIESRGGEFGVPGSLLLWRVRFNGECDSSGGVFEESSTSCVPFLANHGMLCLCAVFNDECDSAGGSLACCLDSGECILVSADDCLIAGGSSDAIDCASSSCAPSVPAALALHALNSPLQVVKLVVGSSTVSDLPALTMCVLPVRAA